IDTLMITPIVPPAGSSPSDMTSIQPVIGEVYDVKLISNQPVFNDYVALSFSYTDTQVTGIDESSLNIYTFDEDQQEWRLAQPDSSLVYRDYENNIITIYTHHLSLYVLSGKVFYVDNPNIISFGVINNPFSPNDDSIKDKVYVTAKADQDSTIHLEIYNSGWDLIREYSADVPENTIVNFNWDGKDVNGNIQNDGMYYAQVHAVNSGGLRSSVVFSKVYIDNTPPGIVISGVQDCGIYNIDVIPEITVFDVFIESLSITLNGMNFNSGTVISAEGNYSLIVSASDKAGNNSNASVQFLIDKTPSLSSIVYYPFSMEDGQITIIKQTEFEITSVDGGNPPSGMYKTEYKIIDDYYYDSGWLNYIEPFTLEDYQPGLWTIRYRGIDNAGNPEPNKNLTVKIGELFDEDESSITAGTVCLIWIDHEMLNENSPGIIKLKEILDEIVVYYKMVFEKDEFVNEFRTNLYNVYLIFGKDDSLGKLPSDELKAHIRLGRGIISSKFTGFTGEGNESEVFGVKFTGHYPGEANTITITNSFISSSDTVTISTQLERLELISPYSSQAAYYEFNNSSTPVIVLNSYGDGKAVYFGFDFIESITNDNMEVLGNILKNSVELVRKPIIYKFPSVKIPIQFDLRSAEVNVSLKVKEETPDVMEIIETIPEADLQNLNSAEWYFDMLPGEDKTLLSINRLPEALGYYELFFEVYTKINGTYNLHSTFIYGFEMEFEKESYINEMIFDLIQLPVESNEQKWLENIIQILDEIKNTNIQTKNDCLNAIKDLFTAKNNLDKITSVNTYEIYEKILILVLYHEAKIESINTRKTTKRKNKKDTKKH
ncbi:hypothetical protein KAU33_03100, partial [Candidatus Dependentiae bacterium]|nr:hypothetical protein [Candidatus Dependentiae bacterium]